SFQSVLFGGLQYMASSHLKPVNIGLIGCGVISSVYLEKCKAYEHMNVVACADLDLERARAQARRFDIPRAEPVEDVLADPSIELVINLTIPAAHAAVGMAALRSGKS